MNSGNVKSIINRILWDPYLSPKDFKAVYADRFESTKEFSLIDVERVEGSLIMLNGGRVIPAHRIRKIYNAKTGEVLLSR